MKILTLLILTAVSTLTLANEHNLDENGVMLGGYDPVSYIESKTAQPGSNDWQAEHNNARYWFSSEANKTKFMENPDKFVPAFGGFCSYGIAMRKKLSVDPEAFWVEDDRLFLQLDHGTQAVWEKDRVRNIEVADRIWPNIKQIPAAQLNAD